MKTNEAFEFKTLLKVIIGLVIFVGLIYFFTDNVVKKDNTGETETKEENNFNNTIAGLMFGLPEKEYYILLYDSTNKVTAPNYDTMQSSYLQSTTVTKLYYVDLNEAFNSKYYVKENSNPKATKLEELKIKDGTLLEFKDNKITSYTEGYQNIYKKLN